MYDKRKTDKANLENKKWLFLQMGLVLVLGITLFVFEKDYTKVNHLKNINFIQINIEEETFYTTTPKISKPKPVHQDLSIASIIISEANIKHKDTENEFFTELPLYNFEFNEEEVEEYIKYHKIENRKPQFPGGIKKLRKYIGEHSRYPQAAIDSFIEGKVYIHFIVDKKGLVNNIKVIREIHPLLDNEAIRVVSEMPRWTPGITNGYKTNVPIIVPVTFILKK